MSTIDLEPEHAESLLRLIEASLQVKRRHQFYHWTQGDMQRLVPHKLSSCGAYDQSLRDLSFCVLNSLPLPDAIVALMADGQSTVMNYLKAEWSRSGQSACVVDLQGIFNQDKGAKALCDHGYRWFMVNGVSRPGKPHELESFFAFGQPDCQPASRSVHLMHMLLPYLHATFVRAYGTERELAGMGNFARVGLGGVGVVDKQKGSSNITDREREILRWVREGKSNQAISDELGISALTVKNHVQKILRKLGAANRAQAVAKAMSMNLFTPSSELPSRHLVAEAPMSNVLGAL
jgi:transcriptional regulator EpsA